VSDIRLGYHRFNICSSSLFMIFPSCALLYPSSYALLRAIISIFWVVICDHGTRVLIFVFSYLFHELLKLAKYNLKIFEMLAVFSFSHSYTDEFFQKEIMYQFYRTQIKKKPQNPGTSSKRIRQISTEHQIDK